MSETPNETQTNQIKTEKDSKAQLNDSFDKVFALQKLIHKQAGLKRLCKFKLNLYYKNSY